jgi:phage terminase large subunit-like protein
MTTIPKPIQDYIDIVEGGKTRVCEEQKQLVEYVKNVFATEKLKYDILQIEKYLSYQRYFPYDLFEWEIFCFVLFTCIFRTDGTPRWSDLFAYMGRGAGKNGFLSFLCFCLITDTNGVAYYDVDICATSEDQAKTSFVEIHDILETPQFTKLFKKHFRWNRTEIQNIKTRSTIKFRTNNAKGKDGLRSGIVVFDEVHAYENWENINVFTTGLGKKPHPRRIYITTNGDVREGPLDALLNKSRKILKGELPDNEFLPFLCQLDADEEVHDPKNWEKANPSLPYLPNLRKEIEKEYADYKEDPIINSGFMTKRMNRPQGNKDAEVASWENILKTNGELPDLKGKTCICGIDFSKTTDFVSAFLLFKVKEMYYGIHHSWFCTACNDKHRIKIPLNDMAKRGLLTIVDDVEIHPSLIAEWISEMRMLYDIDKIAIDNYRYALLSRELASIGYEAKDKTVKLVRPSDIMLVQPKIHSWFVGNKIIWGDDPLMRWYTNNTKLESAPNNNFKYGKIEPKSRKTDGFMAFVAAVTLEEELPDDSDFMFFDPIIL